MSNHGEGPPGPKNGKDGAGEKLIRAAEMAAQVEDLKALIYDANERIREHQAEIETLAERVEGVAISPDSEQIRRERIRTSIYTTRAAADQVSAAMARIVDAFGKIENSPEVSVQTQTAFRESIDLLVSTREQLAAQQRVILANVNEED